MQRIIGGSLGGRYLLPLPKSCTGVRPCAARVREALFARIQSELVGAHVLDLFAGSGALAIESLSRGAEHAVLVEKQKLLADFLHRQLAALGLTDRAVVQHQTAQVFLRKSPPRPFDIVFVAPPYAEHELYSAALSGLGESGWLSPEAVLVCERALVRGKAEPDITWPQALSWEKSANYGQTILDFLRVQRQGL